MTRERQEDRAGRVKKAMRTLYGEGHWDLTAEGFTEAIKRLRRQDETKARWVERCLDPVLKVQAFPRRGRNWHESSVGRRARLILLPQNPHFKSDLHACRQVLGISGRIEKHLAGHWLYVHDETAMKRTVTAEVQGVLAPELQQSAVGSARVNLAAEGIPQWLRRAPSGPDPFNQSAVPLNWVARRLVERYRLPWTAASSLVLYVLTEDPGYIANIGPCDVDVTYRDKDLGDPEAFTVSVKGLDEFVTKEDWDSVWERHVKPRQEELWKRRGMRPQGRRTIAIERLQEAIPLYRKMVEEGLSINDLLCRAAVADGDRETAFANADPETIRRAMRDLSKLLSPSD